MSKFIEVCDYDSRNYYYLNTDCIAYIQEMSDRTAKIGMLSIHSSYHSSNGDTIHVTESYRQIKEMINNEEM